MQAEPSAVASGKLLAELDLQKNMELTDEVCVNKTFFLESNLDSISGAG